MGEFSYNDSPCKPYFIYGKVRFTRVNFPGFCSHHIVWVSYTTALIGGSNEHHNLSKHYLQGNVTIFYSKNDNSWASQGSVIMHECAIAMDTFRKFGGCSHSLFHSKTNKIMKALAL